MVLTQVQPSFCCLVGPGYKTRTFFTSLLFTVLAGSEDTSHSSPTVYTYTSMDAFVYFRKCFLLCRHNLVISAPFFSPFLLSPSFLHNHNQLSLPRLSQHLLSKTFLLFLCLMNSLDFFSASHCDPDFTSGTLSLPSIIMDLLSSLRLSLLHYCCLFQDVLLEKLHHIYPKVQLVQCWPMLFLLSAHTSQGPLHIPFIFRLRGILAEVQTLISHPSLAPVPPGSCLSKMYVTQDLEVPLQHTNGFNVRDVGHVSHCQGI